MCLIEASSPETLWSEEMILQLDSVRVLPRFPLDGLLCRTKLSEGEEEGSGAASIQLLADCKPFEIVPLG